MALLETLAPSIITGIGHSVGSLLGFGSQKSANKANMELAKYQYDRALDMWNMQNAYNTPSEQRKRLMEAGLNPNLVYGNGQVQGLTSAPAPQYQAPHIGAYTNFGSLGVEQAMTTYMGLSKMQADIQNTKANTANTEATTANVLAQHDLIPQQYQLNQLEIIRRGIENAKNDIDREFWHKQWENVVERQAAEIENLDSRTDLIKAQTLTEAERPANIKADTSLKQAQEKTEGTKQVLNNSAANLNNAKAEGQLLENDWIDAIKSATHELLKEQWYNTSQNSKYLDLRMELAEAEITAKWVETDGKLKDNEIKKILIKYGINLYDTNPQNPYDMAGKILMKTMDLGSYNKDPQLYGPYGPRKNNK